MAVPVLLHQYLVLLSLTLVVEAVALMLAPEVRAAQAAVVMGFRIHRDYLLYKQLAELQTQAAEVVVVERQVLMLLALAAAAS